MRPDTEEKSATRTSAGEAADMASKLALDTALASLDDSKAEDILPIDIRGKSSLADHMVIASGRSNRHVAAITEHLITALKQAGVAPQRVEGLPAADWVLIDQGDVIIHVFRPEVRAFYNLEKMWLAPEADDKAQADTVH